MHAHTAITATPLNIRSNAATWGRVGGRGAHRPPRLLIVPGLQNSGPAHWQTWLQSLHHDAVRVTQSDWSEPDLERWSAQIADTLAEQGPGPWLVAAHSFGCLALAHHLARRPELPAAAALLVAPADPVKFGLVRRLPHTALPCETVLVGSTNDPWMSAKQAHDWARRWGSRWLCLEGAGHINAEAGFGPWPYAQRWAVKSRHRHAVPLTA